MLQFSSLSGDQLIQQINTVAQLRITVFREFPYLYDGDLDYEARYLDTYIKAKDSVVVLAYDGTTVVGAATAVPLQYETAEVQQPFITAGYNPADVFYLGESVLLPQYRGQGAGVAFFNHREAHAQKVGPFKYICFCAVQRPLNHPHRPTDYQPLDQFWQHRGYSIQPQLHTTISWKELGETHEAPKPMTFWMKTLA